ncbi:MAG: hypothetical protein M1308_17475, partial [Actinobacteria bacterium]|nr:hypothetical protein [Actinomycetota bacterium]
YAPKGIPDEISKKLYEGFTKILKDPAFLGKMKGEKVDYYTQEEVRKMLARDDEALAKMINESPIGKEVRSMMELKKKK